MSGTTAAAKRVPLQDHYAPSGADPNCFLSGGPSLDVLQNIAIGLGLFTKHGQLHVVVCMRAMVEVRSKYTTRPGLQARSGSTEVMCQAIIQNSPDDDLDWTLIPSHPDLARSRFLARYPPAARNGYTLVLMAKTKPRLLLNAMAHVVQLHNGNLAAAAFQQPRESKTGTETDGVPAADDSNVTDRAQAEVDADVRLTPWERISFAREFVDRCMRDPRIRCIMIDSKALSGIDTKVKLMDRWNRMVMSTQTLFQTVTRRFMGTEK